MFDHNGHIQRELLLCRQCGELHPLAAAAPYQTGDAELEAADLEQFRQSHRGHTLERALRLPEAALHDRPAWDPMATSWYRVLVGETSFYVRSSRFSIDLPRRHWLQMSAPLLSAHVELDEPLLQQSLSRHFHPQALPAEKAARFVVTLRELISGLDIDQIETSFDDPELANAELGPCPEPVCAQLLAQASGIFSSDWERSEIARFIEENRSEYGALAVRVRREVIAQPA
jgi:hypothetical protein